MRRGAASRPQGKASCEGRRDRGRSEGKKQEISTSRANLEGNGAQHASWVWCTPGTIMTSLIHHVFPMKRNTLNTPGHRMPPERVQETGILGGGGSISQMQKPKSAWAWSLISIPAPPVAPSAPLDKTLPYF